MSGLQMNSITGAGTAAATSVASALVPNRHTASPATSLAAAAATAKTAATATTSTTTSTGSSGDITSTDFLTLLVSELKNQDPTQPTDPNAYITQLVGVNSLQQLISIDQDLTPTTTTTGS
jgi:flagellar basal-body rod modification protein FlgD